MRAEGEQKKKGERWALAAVGVDMLITFFSLGSDVRLFARQASSSHFLFGRIIYHIMTPDVLGCPHGPWLLIRKY